MQSSKQRYVQFVQQLRRPGSLLAPGGNRSGPATGEARPASAFPRYLRLLRPQSRPLLAVVLVALLTIGIDMLWPLVSAYLVDKVILNSELEAADKLGPIAWLGGGMAGLYALGAALNWWRSFRMQTLNARLSFSLRARLLDKVLRLPLSELSNLPTGGLLSRLSSDVDATAGLLQQALVSPALASLRLVVTLGIIFALNARIAVLVLLVIPPVMALQALRAGRMRPIWRSMSQDRQAIDGRVNEGLSGVRVVRTFRRERSEQRAYTQGHHTVIRKQILATNIQRSIATIWELILPVAQLTMLCYGGYLVTLGQTTIGVVIAFQSYLWRLLEPIMALASSISGTQRGLAAMDRVFELLDQASEPPDPAGALAAPAQVQSIDLDGVGFRYGAGPEVLSDIRLHVPGGSTVALVGPSGAGKTTLTDLLTRLHAPTEGDVRLNGVPVQEYRRGEYRGLFGVVSQDIFLFDGTLRENIAYARPSASEAEVRRAAERANAHEFIEPLAKGYDSVIGERGVKLSGGQRQRLSIARALLADPQILILDEATSNLDTASERWIHRSITELLKGRRTTFIIAHRLSTVAQADQIVLLERGRIAELGSHEELMARGGRYREMVRLQESTQLTLPG